MAASGRAAEGNRGGDIEGLKGIQRLFSQQNNPANPFNPQTPAKEEMQSRVQMGIRAFQWNLKNLFSRPAGVMIAGSH